MKKTCVAVLLLSACAFSVFAMGGREEGASNKVSFMWWGDEARHIATNKAVAAFEKANPGKTVTAMPNPFDGYHDKIIIQLANGTAPDLFCFSTEWLVEVGYAAKPVLKDMKGMKEINFAAFEPTLLQSGEVNGKLIGIPTGISGWCYNYNINELTEFGKKSGLGLPPGPDKTWTVEDMIKYASAFKQMKGEDASLLSTSRDQLAHMFVSMLSEIAGKFYISERAERQFTEKDLLDTLKLFERFTKTGVLPPGPLQVESLNNTPSTYNATGKWVGWFSWTSNIVQNGIVSNSDIGIMAYPTLGRPEFDGLFVRPAQFWSISNASKNPELAASLLDFIVNDPAAVAELQLQRSVPPTEQGQNVLADMGILSGPVYEGTQYLMKTAKAKYTPFILIPELMDTLRNEYSRFITGGASAEDTAKKLVADFDRMLANVRKVNGI